MRDFLDFVWMVLLPVAAILTVAAVAGNEFSRYQCGNYARIAGKPTQYANFDSCYIQTAQGFQRWDEYKLRAAASEGLSK